MFTPMTLYEPSVRVDMTGALATARYEWMAIVVAEGFTENEAWRACGGSTADPGSRRYGRRIFQNPVFKQRVQNLMDEKDRLFEDPIWGEAAWQINQLYRCSVVEKDTKVMLEAVKMRLRIAENMRPPAEAPPPNPTARGPGAPVAENPQSKLNIKGIKAALMVQGREEPNPDEIN